MAAHRANTTGEEDFPEAFQLLRWGYEAASQRRYREAEQIADILRQLGLRNPEDG